MLLDTADRQTCEFKLLLHSYIHAGLDVRSILCCLGSRGRVNEALLGLFHVKSSSDKADTILCLKPSPILNKHHYHSIRLPHRRLINQVHKYHKTHTNYIYISRGLFTEKYHFRIYYNDADYHYQRSELLCMI